MELIHIILVFVLTFAFFIETSLGLGLRRNRVKGNNYWRGGQITQSNYQTGFISNPFPRSFVSDYLNDYSNHPCKRECKPNEPPRICYFNFVAEVFETLEANKCGNCLSDLESCSNPSCIVADGVKTPIISVNRRLPGPPVEVCFKDRVIVDVTNLIDEETTVHWHGMRQHRSPYMDGAPFITQYTIPPNQTYRYDFVPDVVGTYWWHSHVHSQRAFGMTGSLVIRVPSNQNPIRNLYDFDSHTLQVVDWCYNLTLIPAVNILINGKGKVFNDDVPVQGVFETFNVVPGFSYRFRVIFATSTCQMELSVDGHELLLVSVDGNDIEPITVSAIHATPGERYDFILRAQQDVGNYWIFVKANGLGGCDGLYQGAILHYEGAPYEQPKGNLTYNHQYIDGLIMNAPDVPQSLAVSYLRALEEFQWDDNAPVVKVPLVITHTDLGFQINGISFKPPTDPLILQKSVEPGNEGICDHESLLLQGRNCSAELCECTHVVRVPLNSQVEILFTAPTANHSMHLHGYSYRVVDSGFLEDLPASESEMYSKFPPLKDVVSLYQGTFVKIRFIADNPGYWFLHCHVEIHANNGMMMALAVGDVKDIVPKPRNFNPIP